MDLNTPEKALNRLELARRYLSKVLMTSDIKKIKFGINVVRHSINWLDESINRHAETDSENNARLYLKALEIKKLAIADMQTAKTSLMSRYRGDLRRTSMRPRVFFDSPIFKGNNITVSRKGDEFSIIQDFGKKTLTDYKVGTKNTSVVNITVDGNQVLVFATMSLKDLEKSVKDARKRMNKFKRQDAERGNKKSILFAHLSPDISILLEEECRTSKKKTARR